MFESSEQYGETDQTDRVCGDRKRAYKIGWGVILGFGSGMAQGPALLLSTGLSERMPLRVSCMAPIRAMRTAPGGGYGSALFGA